MLCLNDMMSTAVVCLHFLAFFLLPACLTRPTCPSPQHLFEAHVRPFFSPRVLNGLHRNYRCSNMSPSAYLAYIVTPPPGEEGTPPRHVACDGKRGFQGVEV
ncbi:unnamed protein product [Ectocarpus sp. 8 AP-2014]